MKVIYIVQMIVILLLNIINIDSIYRNYFVKKKNDKFLIPKIIGLLLVFVSIFLFSINITNNPFKYFMLILGIYEMLITAYILFTNKNYRKACLNEYDVDWPKHTLYLGLSLTIGALFITIFEIKLFFLIIISLVVGLILYFIDKKDYSKNALNYFYAIAEKYYSKEDYINAVRYYEKAAKLNDPKSQNALGVCYDQGLGVTKDYNKAFEYLLKSYNNGCTDSYANIGYYYLVGQGTNQDYNKAFEAYSKAAINEFPVAYYYMGEFYELGRGTEQNYEKAYEYYNKSHESGNYMATYKLGLFYENGYHVGVNFEKAYMFYQDSADKGYSLAQEKVMEVNEKKLKEELDKIIGLGTVKDEIIALQSFAKFQKNRKDRNIKGDQNLTLHMIFKGNPGTGKTTIARTVANMFRNIGILKTNKVVEVDREQLVGKYVGHTAAQTKAKVEEALDGVLFIDEAYTLSKGGETDFGREAIDTLVKLMEDYRDRLVVILAGYSDEMEDFLETNPGLRSRFPNIIEFPNYSTDELMQIAELFCGKNGYRLNDGSRAKLRQLLETERYEPDFGNGRGVRNVFEKSVRNMARRLSQVGDYKNVSDEELQVLEAEDMEI